jgi:hypothetical protein
MQEHPEALSIGSVVGGPETTKWEAAITEVRRQVDEACVGITSPLKVNVVFHVPGSILKPDYEGVRTGSFFRKHGLLVVQVALPEEAPEDPAAHLRRAMVAAIAEAEAWARRKRIATELPELRELVKKL